MPSGSLVTRILSEAGALLRLAGPLMAAQLAYMAMGFVDTVMVGRVGPTALAAVALGTSFWQPLYLFSLGVLIAASTSVAHLYGAGRLREIGPLTRQALWLSLLLAVPVVALLHQATWAMQWLAVSPELVPVAQDYLRALSWGAFPAFAFVALRCLSEGIAFTRPIMVIGFVGLGVNVLGNYLLIYGKLGFPALGAFGCGLATSISYLVMLLCLAVLVLRHPRYRLLRVLRDWDWPAWEPFQALLKLGLPIGLSIFIEGSVFAAVALVLGVFGATVVAGHQIALNVAAMSFMLPLSLALAITVRVGHAMGRQDPGHARLTGFTGIALAGLIMTAMAFLIAGLARPIAGIYTDDLQVISVAAGLLQFAALFQIPDGLQVSANGALRGLKDTRGPMLITVLAYWLCGFPAGYVLGIFQNLGAVGLWIGLIVGLSVAAVLLVVRFCWVMGVVFGGFKR